MKNLLYAEVLTASKKQILCHIAFKSNFKDTKVIKLEIFRLEGCFGSKIVFILSNRKAFYDSGCQSQQ